MFSMLAVPCVVLLFPSPDARCAGHTCSELNHIARSAANLLLVGIPMVNAGAATTEFWQRLVGKTE